jgi:hypothetical protein
VVHPGELLEHGELSLNNASPPPPSYGIRMLYMHIPKTAGTSIRNLIQENLNQCECCWIYEGESNHLSSAAFTKLPLYQQEGFRIIGGHIHLSFSDSVPKPH